MATDIRQWAATCALFVALLAATSCSSQARPGGPAPSASPLADNLAGPPTQTPQPSPTADPPTATPTPTPSPTPTPRPALHQLTRGGCCTQPFWSPDSRRVLFIDKPDPDAPLGIWGVDATRPDPAPELFTERIAFYTADLAFAVELSEDTTTIERLGGTDGARWTVPAGGLPVYISPGRKRIAWEVSNRDLPFERRTAEVWVANLDGSDARSVATLKLGGFSDWISDDLLLLSGRESLQSREQVLYTFSLSSGREVELARSERLRGGLLSPDGTWLAYYVALSDDLAENGLWMVRTDGSERRKLDRSLFGAFKWRDAHRLLIIPFRPEAVSHELWELDANTWEARRLTDPDATPFKIANGDWTVSPDGRYVAFVESRDRNIWLLALAD
jgi:Tol biopolymer transport system component